MMVSYKSSRRYGGELNDVFKATFIDGLAETKGECKQVVNRTAPVRLHKLLTSPIFPLPVRTLHLKSGSGKKL
jgi:hypothetical protein